MMINNRPRTFDRVSGPVVAETQEIFKEWKYESISESLQINSHQQMSLNLAQVMPRGIDDEDYVCSMYQQVNYD